MADARQPGEHRSSNGQENGENDYSAYGSAYRENGYHIGAATHPGATGMNTACISLFTRTGMCVSVFVCVYTCVVGPQLWVKVICCVRQGHLIHPKGSAGSCFSGDNKPNGATGLQTFQSRLLELPKSRFCVIGNLFCRQSLHKHTL